MKFEIIGWDECMNVGDRNNTVICADGSTKQVETHEIIKNIIAGNFTVDSGGVVREVVVNNTTIPVNTGYVLHPAVTPQTSYETSYEYSEDVEKEMEEREKLNEYLTDTLEIRKVLAMKKYKDKFKFKIKDPVSFITYHTIYDDGMGDKMDIMNKNFIGGEKLVLKSIFVQGSKENPERTYRFLIEDGGAFMDVDEDRCFDHIEGLDYLFDAVEHERRIVQRREEKKKLTELKKAEEKELQTIVSQAQHEAMGFGSW